MGFRASTSNYWARIKSKDLTKDAFILALFVELYPAAHHSGLYSVPLIDIQENTGLSEGEISVAMDELERAGLALFDRSRMIVFVPGMMLRQLGVKKINAKQEKGIFVHLEGFSTLSPTVTAFIQFYGLVLPDTPTDTSIPYPHPIPAPDTGMAYNLNLRPGPEDETRDLRPTPNDTLALGALEAPAHRVEYNDNLDDTPEARKAFLRQAAEKIGADHLLPGNGSGKSVNEGKARLDAFIGTLADPEKKVFNSAYNRVRFKKICVEDAMVQLQVDGLSEEQLAVAEEVLKDGEQG